MKLRTFGIRALPLVVLLVVSGQVFAQKAGTITKFVQPAMVVQAPARTGLQEVSTAITGANTQIKWHDILRTGEGGRMRAQLTDGSILSIGSKSQLTVNKHDEKTQQTDLELGYGKVRSQVVHLARPDSNFEVRTATAVCGVLGTDDIVDAENPTATVVIVISGVVTVRSANPAVVGSVQLTAGQTTTVGANQPPTTPTQANLTQVTGGVNGTSGTTTPDPTVSQTVSQLPAGQPLVLDGRSSTGGLGSIVSYLWSFTPNPFVGGVQQPDLSQPTLNLDTTGWAPAAYTGRLTVVNTQGVSSNVSFTFSVVPGTASIPPPDSTVTALAAAYETLQVRSFMNLFDPNKYTGYAALEQSITQSFANIQSNRVFVQKASGQTSGNTAILQVNFSIRFTPKSTALPSATSATSIAVPVRSAQARGPSATGLGSISGSAGAVATFIVVTGPVNTGAISPNNALTYTVPNLPNGTYTVTAVRNGFTFSPATRTVVIANGAAVTGVDFTSQPIEQTVNESATMRMEYQGQNGWIITDIQGALGSAGLVGIPGTNNPLGSNIPGSSGAGAGLSGIGGTSSFGVSSPATYNVLQGGGNAANPAVVTLTSNGGFSGPVAMAFQLPAGVTLVSGPTSINIANGASTATGSYVFSISNQLSGLIVVPYTATAGGVTQNGFITLQAVQLNLAVTGTGQTAGTPLQLFSGNSGGTSLVASTTPAGSVGTLTYTATPNVAGVTATVTPGANGAATLALTSTDSATGPLQVTVTATVAGGGSASTTVFVNRVPPVVNLSLNNSSLTVASGQPGSISVSVTYNSGFTGSVIVTPPTISGLTFTPASQPLTQSGTATFTVTATGSPATTSGVFTVAAGAYRATVAAGFTINPPFDFTLSPASLTLTAGTTAPVNIVVTDTGGAGALPVQISVSGLPTGVTLGPNGVTSLNGSGTFVLNVIAAQNAPLGSTSFQVTGTGGGQTHTITVPLTITTAGSFTLNVTPSTVNVFDGGSGSVNVGVQAVGPFVGNVAITSTSTVAQATGPASIVAGASGTYSVTATSAGTLTFIGTGAGLTQSVPVSVAIVPGFSMSATNGSSFPGGTTSVTVNLTRASGFTAPVVVTPSSSGGATFDPPSAIVTGNSVTFNVTIPASASGSSFGLSFSGTAQGGNLAVTAQSSVALAAPFSLSGGSVTGFAGQTIQITVGVSRATGFTGTVIVSPAGGIPGVIVTPSSATVAPGSTSATFVATIPAGAQSGTISFNGTGAGLTTGASVNLTVTPPFTLSAGTNLGSTIPGGTLSAPVSVQFASGFNGSVTLSTSVVGPFTAGLGAQFFNASGATQLNVSAPSNANPGQGTITVTAASGSYTATATYTAQVQVAFTAQAASNTSLNVFHGGSTSLGVQVNFSQGFSGPLSVSTSAPSGISVNGPSSISSSGNVTFNLSASSNASSGPVNITLTGGGNSVTIPFNVSAVDPYSIAVTSPSSLSGTTPGQLTATVTALNGFSGQVLVTPSVSPAGSATINPTSQTVSVSSVTSVTFTVTLTNGFGGSQVTFSATGTSGSFAATASGSPTNASGGSVAPYQVSTPTGTKIFSGLSTQVQFTVSQPGGLTHSVVITPGSLPSGIVSVSPSSQVATSGNATVTFTVTGSNSNSGITSGSLGFTATDNTNSPVPITLNYTLSDPVTITQTPPSSVLSPSTTNYTVTVTPQNGFTGSVVITSLPSNPSGGTVTASVPQTLTFSSASAQTPSFALTVGSGVTQFDLRSNAQVGGFSQTTGVATLAPTAGSGTFGLTIPGAIQLFSKDVQNVVIMVNYTSGFSGTVTVSTPSAPAGLTVFGGCDGTVGPQRRVRAFDSPGGGFASQSVTPSNPYACFTLVGNSSNPSAVNGTLTYSGSGVGGGGNHNGPQNYSVIDPFTISAMTPVVTGGSTNWTVVLTPNAGFNGPATVAPTATSSGGTLSPNPGFVSHTVSGPTSYNFTFTGGGGTYATYMATGSADFTGFQAVLPSFAFPPYSIAISPSSPAVIYSSLSTNVDVTVTFNGANTAPVTISAPGSTTNLASITTSNGTATPGSPTVHYTILGTQNNPGPTPSTGSFSFSASNGSYSTSALESYSIVNPIAVTLTPPTSLSNSAQSSYTISVQTFNGYSGSVTITPSVGFTGGSGVFSGAQTVNAPANATTQYTFTVTPGSGVTSATFSAIVTTGGFTATPNSSTVNVNAPFSIAASAGPYQFFSSVGVPITITATFASGYNGTVTITPQNVGGGHLQTVSPATLSLSRSTPSGQFTFTGTSSNPTLINGVEAFNASDGTSTATTGNLSYTVVDPYTLTTQTVPANLYSGVPASFVVQAVAASGFSATALITPKITPSNAATFSPTSRTVIVGPNTTATFSVTLNDGIIGTVTLGADSSIVGGTFTLSTTAPSSTTAAAPYTVVVTPNPIKVYDSLQTPVNVAVTFVTGYSGTVTVFPSATPVGIGSVTPSSQNAVANGSGGTVNLAFNVTGNGTGNANLTFAGTAGGNNATGSTAYTASLPFSVSTPSNVNLFDGQSTSVNVVVTPLNGFSGTVSVFPAGSGGPSGNAPTGVTLPNGSPQQQSVSGGAVTYSISYNTASNAPVASASDAFVITTGAYSTTNNATIAVAQPFSTSQTLPSSLVQGGTMTYSVTLNPTAGFTGSVTVTPNISSTPANSATISAAQTVLLSSPASQTLNFTVTTGGSTTAVNLGAAVNETGTAFSLALGPSSVSVNAPFTITPVTSSPVSIYDQLVTTVEFQVTYNPNFTGTTTVSFVSATGGGVASVAAVNGGGTSTTITGSQPVDFNVTGQLANTGVMTFSVTNGSTTETATLNYRSSTPFTVSGNPATILLFNGHQTTTSVTVTSVNGYAGAIEYIAPGSGLSTSGSLPGGVSFDAGGSGHLFQSITAGGSTTFNVAYDTAANAALGSTSDNFIIKTTAGTTYQYSSATTMNVNVPFTATLGSGSAGPMTVPLFGGTNGVDVTITRSGGYTGNVTVTPPSTSGASVSGAQTCSTATCTFTFTLTGGTTATPLQTVNYTAATTEGYSVALQSQYDVTSPQLTNSVVSPSTNYLIGDTGVVTLTIGSISSYPFYGSVQITPSTSLTAPFTGWSLNGPTTLSLASGPVSPTLNFVTQGTDADTGAKFTPPFTLQPSGSPHMTASLQSFTNYGGGVILTAPFTLAFGNLVGPNQNVITGATGLATDPNQTYVPLTVSLNTAFTGTMNSSTNSAASISACYFGQGGCPMSKSYSPSASFTDNWYFRDNAATTGSASENFVYSHTGTGGGTFTTTKTQAVNFVAPFTFGTPDMSNPIPITQGGEVILTYPVTFASGYNSASAPVAASATSVPTGITVTPSQSATTGTPSVKLTIDAAAGGPTGTTGFVTVKNAAVAGTSYVATAQSFDMNIAGAGPGYTVTYNPSGTVLFPAATPQVITFTVNPTNGFSGSVKLSFPDTGTNSHVYLCGSSGAGYCATEGSQNSFVLPADSVSQAGALYTGLSAGGTVSTGSDTIVVTTCMVNSDFLCTDTPKTINVAASVSRPVPSVGLNNVTGQAYQAGMGPSTFSVTVTSENGFANNAAISGSFSDPSGLSGCFPPDSGIISSDSPSLSTGGGAVTFHVQNNSDNINPVAFYASYDGNGGSVCIGSNGSPYYGYNPTFAVGGMAKRKGVGNGDLSITAKDVTFMPTRPRAGEPVVFRVKVSNLGTADVKKVAIAMMIDGVEASRVVAPAIPGGKYARAEFAWKAGTGHQVSFVVDPDKTTSDPDRSNNTALLANMKMAVGNGLRASRQNRMSLTVRNEACAGVRMASSSQSSCGGRNDVEMQPSIRVNGRLTIETVAPDGGIQDLGAIALTTLPDVTQLTGGTLGPAANLQQGHAYLLKSGNRLSVFRVVRISSTLNPKLGALLAGPVDPRSTRGAGGANPGNPLGDLRSQQQSDQILNNAQVMIELEWVQIESQQE